jgi:hypothetical protein
VSQYSRGGGGGAVAAGAEPGATAATASADDLARQIQFILHVPQGDGDPLDAIADAMKGRSNDGFSPEGLRKVADALLIGQRPEVLTEKILPTVEVGGTSDATQEALPGWKYGSYFDRTELARALWGLAVAIKKDNPKLAAETAKASLILGALNDYQFGWGVLRNILSKADEARNLLGISDAEFNALTEVVRKRQSQVALYTEETTAGLKMMDAVDTSAPDAPADQQVELLLKHLDKAFREGPPQDGNRWWIINQVWKFLNGARAAHRARALELMQRQLEQWDADYPRKNIHRWVQEALSRVGAPPKGKFHGEFEVRPGGKIAPVQMP